MGPLQLMNVQVPSGLHNKSMFIHENWQRHAFLSFVCFMYLNIIEFLQL